MFEVGSFLHRSRARCEPDDGDCDQDGQKKEQGPGCQILWASRQPEMRIGSVAEVAQGRFLSPGGILLEPIVDQELGELSTWQIGCAKEAC